MHQPGFTFQMAFYLSLYFFNCLFNFSFFLIIFLQADGCIAINFISIL